MQSNEVKATLVKVAITTLSEIDPVRDIRVQQAVLSLIGYLAELGELEQDPQPPEEHVA